MGCQCCCGDSWADPLEVERTYGIKLGEISADQQVDSLIVAVGHDEFRDLAPEMLREFLQGVPANIG